MIKTPGLALTCIVTLAKHVQEIPTRQLRTGSSFDFVDPLLCFRAEFLGVSRQGFRPYKWASSQVDFAQRVTNDARCVNCILGWDDGEPVPRDQ